MKIEILAPQPPFSRGYNINKNGKKIQNINSSLFPIDFSEDEIEFILGDKDYEKFENGKYTFDVPAWKLNIVAGEQACKNREQLLFYSEFIEL
jgi:hypothetical protein